MAEISEVSSDLVCYLCESPFITSSNSFILYKCKMCNEKTAYCFNCSKITKKLLGNALFRCSICNNIVKAYCKEEISKHSQNDFNNNDKDFSPFKSQNIQINNIMKSPLMPNSSNRNIFYSNSSMQNPRYDYSYQREIEDNKNNFLEEFTNKLIIHNPFNDNSNGNRPTLTLNKSNDCLLGNYNLLSKKKKDSTKKAIQLNLKDLDISVITPQNKNDSFNKKIKRFCTNGDSNEKEEIQSIFNNTSLQKLSLLNNNQNIYKIAGFGETNKIGNPKLTPHKFYVN